MPPDPAQQSWLSKLKSLLGLSSSASIPESIDQLDRRLRFYQVEYDDLMERSAAIEDALAQAETAKQAGLRKAARLRERLAADERSLAELLRQHEEAIARKREEILFVLPGEVPDEKEQDRKLASLALALPAEVGVLRQRIAEAPYRIAQAEGDVEAATAIQQSQGAYLEIVKARVTEVERKSGEVLQEQAARTVKIYDGPWLHCKPVNAPDFDPGQILIRMEIDQTVLDLAAEGKESQLLQELQDAVAKIVHDAADPCDGEIMQADAYFVSDDELTVEGATESFALAHQAAMDARKPLTGMANAAIDDILRLRAGNRKAKIIFRIKSAFSLGSGVGSVVSAVARGVASAGADVTAYIQTAKSIISIVLTINALNDSVDKAFDALQKEVDAFEEACTTDPLWKQTTLSVAALMGVPKIDGVLSTVEKAMKFHAAKMGGLDDTVTSAVGDLNQMLTEGRAIRSMWQAVLEETGMREMVAVEKAISDLLDNLTKIGGKLASQRQYQIKVDLMVRTYRSGSGKPNAVVNEWVEAGQLAKQVRDVAVALPDYIDTAKGAIDTLSALF